MQAEAGRGRAVEVVSGYAAFMSGVAKDAVTERVFRDSAVSRTKALIAAIVIGMTVAVATYRVLRSRP
jgi:hypothetical protein